MKKTLLIVLFCLIVWAFVRVISGLPAKLEKMDCIKAKNTCTLYGGDCAFASKCKAE